MFRKKNKKTIVPLAKSFSFPSSHQLNQDLLDSKTEYGLNYGKARLKLCDKTFVFKDGKWMSPDSPDDAHITPKSIHLLDEPLTTSEQRLAEFLAQNQQPSMECPAFPKPNSMDQIIGSKTQLVDHPTSFDFDKHPSAPLTHVVERLNVYRLNSVENSTAPERLSPTSKKSVEERSASARRCSSEHIDVCKQNAEKSTELKQYSKKISTVFKQHVPETPSETFKLRGKCLTACQELSIEQLQISKGHSAENSNAPKQLSPILENSMEESSGFSKRCSPEHIARNISNVRKENVEQPIEPKQMSEENYVIGEHHLPKMFSKAQKNQVRHLTSCRQGQSTKQSKLSKKQSEEHSNTAKQHLESELIVQHNVEMNLHKLMEENNKLMEENNMLKLKVNVLMLLVSELTLKNEDHESIANSFDSDDGKE